LVIPPPNVTGKLHLGHVMDTIPDDIVARYKRMKGYDVLWVPGMDHAGIATQAKVEEKLRKEGISRYDLAAEAFLKEAWKWKDEYAKTIHEQWAKLGLIGRLHPGALHPRRRPFECGQTRLRHPL
jgi:valyl-tRNA synthetase